MKVFFVFLLAAFILPACQAPQLSKDASASEPPSPSNTKTHPQISKPSTTNPHNQTKNPHSSSHSSAKPTHSHHSHAAPSQPIPLDTHHLLSNVQEFTFDGSKTGEGYFSQDGRMMIFQSEREPNNPFYQIYVRNLETGNLQRLTPGYGKSTCAWIHPSNKKAMFSSTHKDPQSKKLMKEEIDFRKSGKERRYSWDYDKNYDIYESDLHGKHLKALTHELGYDAEGSYSPDGKYIAFASNREAYQHPLKGKDLEYFKQDPAYAMDIYIMNSDGSHVRRLTHTPGYDGGPFFSPDGKKIVWRRFAPDGMHAEIHTMNIDGSDEKQLTHLKAMSWAPFYHPSGDYIIFTTSINGFKNFELYIVDAEGKKDPVRVTYMDGFDGLPVFTPDGSELTWTRRAFGISQIYKAQWDDQKARQLLGLKNTPIRPQELSYKIQDSDSQRIINYLASSRLKGRTPGSPEAQEYTNMFAELFQHMGLKPGYKKSYFHTFEFNSGSELGSKNQLLLENPSEQLTLHKDWIPLPYSQSGSISSAPLVFAGYGIKAPESDGQPAYDSFEGLDVKGKWVVMFRYQPEETSAERRVYLSRYSKLYDKVMQARNLGAHGVIIVSGPSAHTKRDLIPFDTKGQVPTYSIPVISLSTPVATRLFALAQKNLSHVQSQLDHEKKELGFDFPKIKFQASIEIKHNTTHARNVLAFLKVPGAKKTLVIGAHGDHLGIGRSPSSLMTDHEASQTHVGADDNASGVASVIELAQYFSDAYQRKEIRLKQNILFAIWSAEELGVLGSKTFLEDSKKVEPWLLKNMSAYINMDMIGRLKKNLVIQGIDSSSQWKPLIETSELHHNLSIILQGDPYLPTDAVSFYLAKVPVVSFFTGSHIDYHTPRDTPDKINFSGITKITNLIKDLALNITSSPKALPYTNIERKSTETRRAFRIYLGTIPDYMNNKVKGVLLSGAIKGSPAAAAGLLEGDIITELSGYKIENIHDFVYALQAIRPEEKTSIKIIRSGKTLSLSITPKEKE